MNPRGLSRRDLLKGLSCGFGYLAFAGLSSTAAGAGSKDSPLAPKAPHFPARAERVIFLCMNGAPSHVDTFDYEPELFSGNGKASARPGRIPGAKLMGSPWPLRKRGESGLWISELFPEVAAHADELCVVRSMQADLPANPEAYLMRHTGSSQFIGPYSNKGFSLWLAGGGTRPGFAYGRTDDLGYEAIESPMHVHDLHATILHLLGLDHERLTYRYAGRDMRLTDVKGVVHKAILA